METRNKAAYLEAPRIHPLKVKLAPYTKPGPNEIVVSTRAVAINPVDVSMQAAGNLIFGWVKYPFILGSDIAGEVIEVGSGESFLKVGDRVVGHCVGIDKRSNKSSEGAFQEYTVLRTNLVSKIPDSMGFENACVLPLGLSTAACGLFMKDYLGLSYPTASSAQRSDSKKSREVVIVWGGSTSVGSNAIQLASLAGYDVFTTSSPKNFSYVKSLGAVEAFDYQDQNTTAAMVSKLKGRRCAGAFAIGNGSLEACIDILATAPDSRKFIAQASMPLDITKMPKNPLSFAGKILGFLWWNVSVFVKAKLKGVSSKFIWGSDLMSNDVGKAIYNDFLPDALARGQYQAKPDARVVGEGLDKIQEAFAILATGVSATKLVVRI